MLGLKELREKRGLTLEEIAKVLGVSHVAVLKWEQGKCAPNSRYLQRLADLLHCTVTDILRLYR